MKLRDFSGVGITYQSSGCQNFELFGWEMMELWSFLWNVVAWCWWWWWPKTRNDGTQSILLMRLRDFSGVGITYQSSRCQNFELFGWEMMELWSLVWNVVAWCWWWWWLKTRNDVTQSILTMRLRDLSGVGITYQSSRCQNFELFGWEMMELWSCLGNVVEWWC